MQESSTSARPAPVGREAIAQLASWTRPDDNAQDVLLAALVRPPVPHTSLAAWFQGALRRRALKTARAEGNRRSRERYVARAEGVRDETRALELAERRAVLASGLRGLEPEARNLLHAHYWEGRSLTSIADQRRCSLSAVKRRHAAALESLRTDLGDPSIGRRDWAVLFWFAGGLTALVLAGGLLRGTFRGDVETNPSLSTTVAMIELVPSQPIASPGVPAIRHLVPATRMTPSQPSEAVPMRLLVPAKPIEPPPFPLDWDAATSIAALD